MDIWSCLPHEISLRLKNLSNLREIRIRDNGKVRTNIGGQWYYLTESGYSANCRLAITLDKVCDQIVNAACNGSVYAYENMLASGYFTVDNGVRIGVCGSVAVGQAVTFRNYTSLCIRIPHKVNCITDEIFEQCMQDSFVVIGPPASGKTTFLKCFSGKVSLISNVLVVDERGEFASLNNYQNECDYLRWTSKKYALEVGIRSMSPDWIVCDELSLDDVPYIVNCANCGVKVACSCHANNVLEFTQRLNFKGSIKNAVLLSKRVGKSEFVANFDE